MSINNTLIEWALNPDGTQGYTWNPITGCLNCTAEGLCKGGMFPCWAYRLANGRLKDRYLANHNIANPMRTGRRDDIEAEAMEIMSNPFYPRFWEERLMKMDLSIQVGKGVFVCDMSDLFGIGIPLEWTNKVLTTIEWNPRNRFYLLTKQPQNLIKFSPFPDNCFVGVSATNSYAFINAIDWLSEVEAKVKYISFEPLLDWALPPTKNMFSVLNWVIIGAQTKPTRYPKIEWVREIVEAADQAGVSVFLKNSLRPRVEDAKECSWAYSIDPDYTLRLRQEVPK